MKAKFRRKPSAHRAHQREWSLNNPRMVSRIVAGAVESLRQENRFLALLNSRVKCG